MFKERNSQSLEANLLQIISEETSNFGHKFVNPDSKAFESMAPRDHDDWSSIHHKLADHHSSMSDDYRQEMRIKSRRGDHAGALEAWKHLSAHQIESVKHRQHALLHDYHKQAKAGAQEILF